MCIVMLRKTQWSIDFKICRSDLIDSIFMRHLDAAVDRFLLRYVVGHGTEDAFVEKSEHLGLRVFIQWTKESRLDG